MATGKYNFPNHRRGTTFKARAFKIAVNGQPIDLTGATIKIQFKKKRDAAAAVTWSTADNSITIAGDTFTMIAKTGAEMNIEPGTYYYDTPILFTNGVTDTDIAGAIEIVNNLTT